MAKTHTVAAGSIKSTAAVAAPVAENKETIVAAAPAAPVENKTTVVAAAAPTKADKARSIFDECYAMATVPQRKDIIQRAVAEAGLTKAGAATYLQNYKDKKGLSVKRAK